MDVHRQDAPPVMQNKLRVIVDESIPERHLNRTTRQLHPLLVQEDGTYLEFDHVRRFREKPTLQAAPPLPLSLGAAFGPTQVTISSKFSTTVEQIFIIGGSGRVDPPPPTKLISDPASKSSLFGGADSSDELDESDHAMSYGPTLTVPILQDASGWEPLSWLPEETTLSVYARVLFGSFEIFDTEIDMTQYSFGPRLTFPLLGGAKDDFSLGLSVSAGPAWLRTDVGNATGFDTSVGTQFRFVLPGGWTFIAGVEVEAFFTEDFFSWGLLPVLGLSLGL